MQRLNQITTQIFVELLVKMQGKQHLKVKNEPFMPLTIERLGDDFQTPWGPTQRYSLTSSFMVWIFLAKAQGPLFAHDFKLFQSEN